MDFTVAIVGEGFVLLAADSAQARSIVVMKQSKNIFLNSCWLCFATSMVVFVLATTQKKTKKHRHGQNGAAWQLATRRLLVS